MGAENMMFATMVDPDIVKKLVTKSAELVSVMERAMIVSGATLMWMADPTSSEDLISPDMFVEYSRDGIKKVIDDVKKESDVPNFVHICGNTLETIQHLKGTGADCLSQGESRGRKGSGTHGERGSGQADHVRDPGADNRALLLHHRSRGTGGGSDPRSRMRDADLESV